MSITRRRLLEHLLPASLCIAALLALGLTPFFVCWISGYGFTCPTQPDVTYYLQLAAQPYYSHALYLSDPMIPGRATFYPWLQYIPLVCLTRWLGLSIFWIQIIWTIAGAVGTGVTLYLFLWLVCRNRWLAAAITICVWADIDLGTEMLAHRFLFLHQIYLVASDFIARIGGHPFLPRPRMLWQWRLSNPTMDLPFIFLQLVVTSIARERASTLAITLSGLVFALTFYVYFYLWTMIAGGLCLGMLVDRPGRRTYAWTLALGFALGWPEIIHDYHALSAEGLKYFELTASPIRSPGLSNNSSYFHPYLVIGELAILGGWVTRRKLGALVLVWCIGCAGVCLSMANLVSGISLHNYHWAWLSVPVMHVMTVAVALDLIVRWKSTPRMPRPVPALLVCAYLASGIYLTASILLLGSSGQTYSMTVYSEYNRQRLVPGSAHLQPDSVIAGDEDFVDLAAVAERQRPLAGGWLANNMIVDDEARRIRFVLDKYLSGINHDSFAILLNDTRSIPREQIRAYLQTYDEVSHDSDRFIDDFKVRYLALPVDQPTARFLSRRWDLIQPGPYWRIWERTENSPR